MKEMERIVKLILLGIFLSIGFTACDNDTEEIFDKSPSERAQLSIAEYKKLLTSAEHGWILEDYVGGEDMKHGGFVFKLNFEEDKVIAGLEMMELFSPGYTVSSGYNVTSEGGVVLSFNEYNGLLHYFSTPSSWSPNSLEGEFEYLITSHDEDAIYLKGKKYGVNMRLIKIKEPGYYDKVVKAFTLALNPATFQFDFKVLSVNGVEVPFSMSSRSLVYQDKNEDGTTTQKVAPFIFNDEGIGFHEPTTINGITVQQLYVDYEEKSFKSEDGKVALYLTYPTPFDVKNTSWAILPNTEDCSDAFNKVFNEIDAENSSVYPEEQLKQKVRFGKTEQGFTGITFASAFIADSSNGHIVSFEVDVKPQNNKELSIRFTGKGNKIDVYQHLKPLVTLITGNSPYKYELNDIANPSVVKLISKNNPDVWFVMKK